MKNEKIMKSRKQTKQIAKWMLSFTFTACLIAATNIVAFAKDPTYTDTGKTVWNDVVDTLVPYIIAMGAVIAAIGGVMWGLGFKNEDSDAQTRGIKTLISGAAVSGIIIAVSKSMKL